MLIASLCVAT